MRFINCYATNQSQKKLTLQNLITLHDSQKMLKYVQIRITFDSPKSKSCFRQDKPSNFVWFGEFLKIMTDN